MHPLSASEIIELWERGVSQAPLERALTMLSAGVESRADELPRLSVGQRDARLAAMYERLFGETLHAFAECPQCGERLEYSMSTRDLELTRETPDDGLALICGDVRLRLRLPDSFDLRAASGCETVAEARMLLARRCIVEVGGANANVDQALSDSMVERIAERLSEADPQAERLIKLSCAGCGCEWRLTLDIERFLWVKINALAKRLLREVHALARAYCWREADILAMSAARRQFYMEMAGA